MKWSFRRLKERLLTLFRCGMRRRTERLFPFHEAVRERAVRVKGHRCFECAMTPEEFSRVKTMLQDRYGAWRELSGEILYCGHLQIGRGYFGLTNRPVLFAAGKGGLGWMPAAVYYPDAGKMMYFICDCLQRN